MANTTQIRLNRVLKEEIDLVLPQIVIRIYELGEDKELIKKITKYGLSNSDLIKVLLDSYRKNELKG